MTEPIRLCFVVTALGLGGAEHALLSLVTALDRRRFSPSVIVLGQEDALAARFAEIGVPPVMLRLSPGHWPFGEVRRYLAAVRAIAPHVLQGWMYHGNLAASFAGARLKVPVCWSVHDVPDAAHGHSRFTRAVIRLSGWYAGRVSRIFNVSARSADYCARHYGWPRARTEIVPNGIDTRRFRPDPVARLAMRNAWGVKMSAPLIGMVARYSPVKNHRLFLEAAARFHQRCPEAAFVMVGKGVDRHNGALMEQVRDFGLEDHVHLLGARLDLERIYPALDVLALTSRSEGRPNVLAEAMSCGVPVLSTDVGDAAGIVGDAGRIVPADADGETIAACWQQLLDTDRACLASLARDRVLARFSVEHVVAVLQASYTKLLGR